MYSFSKQYARSVRTDHINTSGIPSVVPGLMNILVHTERLRLPPYDVCVCHQHAFCGQGDG